MNFKRLSEQKDKTIFVLVDLQTKLLTNMYNQNNVVKNSNILVESSKILNIPLIVTEQYPKGLGPTDERIAIDSSTKVIEKTEFSIFQSESFCQEINKYDNRNIIVIFGIETHICIYQSVLDSLFYAGKKYYTYVIEDACSSRIEGNHKSAINKMEKLKARIENTEMILFQFLGKSGSDEFKKISSLIK